MALQLSYTGSPESLMEISQEFTREFDFDHDGWDFGEVMGIWIQYMNSVAEDIEFSFSDSRGTLELALVENGLFEWEGLPD